MANKDRGAEQLYLESLVANLTGWNDPEARLAKAIRQDEFILFGQPIVALDRNAGLPPRLEVLVRLREEERNLTPPGAFLPFLEYYEMMPALDRWVVEHAIAWWREQGRARGTALNVNLSMDTLGESSFPGFVEQQMSRAAMPGSALCFEVEAVEVVTAGEPSMRSAEKLRSSGCRFAISGFGRDSVSFDALKAIAAVMVKVEGALVTEIHRDPVAYARVKSIQSVCGKVGVETVAEFVELPETMEKLRAVGVRYVQGYGVARPEPLNGAAVGTV